LPLQFEPSCGVLVSHYPLGPSPKTFGTFSPLAFFRFCFPQKGWSFFRGIFGLPTYVPLCFSFGIVGGGRCLVHVSVRLGASTSISSNALLHPFNSTPAEFTSPPPPNFNKVNTSSSPNQTLPRTRGVCSPISLGSFPFGVSPAHTFMLQSCKVLVCPPVISFGFLG